MYYRHNLNYDYPEQSDAHMLKVKKRKDIKLDDKYPYIPKCFLFKAARVFYWLGLNLIVFPLCRFTHGLRIYGKENLKKHKEALKNGAITISNHVFMWDYICVLKAIRPRLAYFPAWKSNFEGSNRHLVRLSGGIPVPEDSVRALIKFNRAIEEVIEQGKWLHFFPEGSLWFFYPDIRPLKKAVFKYAARHSKPIIPITMSFRPREGVMKLFGKKPLVDLHVGEPIYPDTSLSPADAANDMHVRAYHIMQIMNGILPSDPTYNTDQQISNYKKTM